MMPSPINITTPITVHVVTFFFDKTLLLRQNNMRSDTSLSSSAAGVTEIRNSLL